MTGTKEVAVITGASGGVGRACAREFGRHGATVALLARNVDALEVARREVEQLGGNALVIPTDVSREEEVSAAAERVERELGPIDIWVNNAMVSLYGPFVAMEPDEFRHITDVTYLGAVWGTRAALRYMLPRNRGTIVQVGSALATRSIPLQSAYCGAKHALAGFTEAVRTELLHLNSAVHLTIVHLPGVNTTQFTWTRSKMPRQSKPVGTIYQPEVAADAIYFAAHARRKSFLVGMPTVESAAVQKIAASALDHYLADAAWIGSQTDQSAPVRDARNPDNFWHPVPGDRGAHGPFDDQAKPRSLQVWANKHRGWLALAGAGLALAATFSYGTRGRNGRG
jgi:NAD(P)-dependent dehydrogenase (short-subunit alcohol dehydrogenase family)